MLDFGTIFRYKETFYVYLVQIEDLIFVAKIHNPEVTRALVKTRDRKSKNPNNYTFEQPMFCFVVLSTSEFKNHSAHYGNPELSQDIEFDIISTLNEEDLNNLKSEIKEDMATSPILRETIQKMYP